MKSIRRRFTLGLVASLLAVSLGLLQLSLWLIENGLQDTLQAHLEAEAEGLLIAIVKGPHGHPQLDTSRINPSYQRPFSGNYFQIMLPHQVWRSRSLWDNSPDWPEQDGLGQKPLRGPLRERLITYRAEYHRAGMPIIINVAQDYTPILNSLHQVQRWGWAVAGGAVLILLLLLGYAMRSALWPLEQVRRQIAQLQHGQRQQLDEQVPAELQPLVEQINHLLVHTDASLKRSRHALGNLGHALKTPLAVLHNLIRREELTQAPALQHSLQEQIGQIEKRIALELGRARLAADVLPTTYFDCQAELPGLIRTLQMVHGQAIQLDWSAPENSPLPWDREDLLELLGNLLDNACKWAGHRVKLNIRQETEHWHLQIDDDGPGIPPRQRQQAMARGIRLDEQPAGHGLGLDIVNDIIMAWHGRWWLEDSQWGGLSVQIELPIRPAAQ